MCSSALRVLAAAGALATGMVLTFVGAATACAQPADTGGTNADNTPTVSSDSATPSGGGAGESNHGGSDTSRPTSTIGNGRNTVVDPNEPPSTRWSNRWGTGSPRKPSTVRIPVLRIPTADEFAKPGPLPPDAYIGVAEIPIPSLGEAFGAFAQPEPQPAPGPAFRTQEEAPPVADARGGNGGSHPAAAADTPEVYRAPLVVAPPPLVAGAPRAAPVGSAAGAPAAAPGVQPGAAGVAGVRTPPIRGTVPPPVQQLSRPLGPRTGETTTLSYPRYLRSPTVGELAAVALPGVAGLLVLTASGGVIGYRQANSSRYVRTAAVARFLP